jgi:hypothetical protein
MIDNLIISIDDQINSLESEIATLREARAALAGNNTEYLKGSVEFARKNYSASKKRAVIADDMKDAILDMTDEGLKPSAIATVLGIDVTYVYSVRSSALRAA